jgi:hypothetical protein
MKRIIRLTESDITRIVRRVIRENEWSDEEEMEYEDLKFKGHPNLRDYGDSETHNYDTDSFSSDVKAFNNKRDSNPRYQELRSKLASVNRKKEEDRYSDVVSNRPEDFDVDSYNDEYYDTTKSLFDREKNSANPKNFRKSSEYKSGVNRSIELKRNLDNDYRSKF